MNLQTRMKRKFRTSIFFTSGFVTLVFLFTLHWSLNNSEWIKKFILPEKVKEKVMPIPQRHLNIIDYSAYPRREHIECVQLRLALNGALVCLHPTEKDVHVSGMLKNVGVWEPHIVSSLINDLYKCQDCQFIDIGANIGVYTLTVASNKRKVIAVEPVKANLIRLIMGIQVNQLEDQVTVVRQAISDRYEKVRFLQPNHNAGGTMVDSTENSKTPEEGSRRIADVVPTIKLNDLVQVIDFKKAILKVDIEGLEPRAFRAADALFDHVHITRVYMEWSSKGNASANLIQPMLDFFHQRNYRPYDVNDQKRPLDVITVSKIVLNDEYWEYNPDTNTLDRKETIIKEERPKILWFEMTKNWPFDIVWVKEDPKSEEEKL